MITVQFRWRDNDDNTRIVGQFETDWRLKKERLLSSGVEQTKFYTLKSLWDVPTNTNSKSHKS